VTTIELTRKFNETFEQSIAYIGFYNLPKAIEFTQCVEQLLQNIAAFPESYPSRDYLPPEVRRCSFRISARYADDYAIFYEFDQSRDRVVAHAIYPGRFDFSKIFADWR
jgi:plasmid stabilization system protein ParE